MRLQTKLALTSLAVLGAFLTFSGVVLSQAFNANIRASADAEMRLVLYGLLGSVISTNSGISFPANLPEPRLDQPLSGLYARLLDETGRVVWRSPSMVISPFDDDGPGLTATPGAFIFQDKGTSFELTYGFIWEEEVDRGYSLHLVTNAEPFRMREDEFRDTLIAGLGLSALLFIGIQFVFIVRGLAPIRRMSEAIGAIESGGRDRLGDGYPPELLGLAQRLDAYIDHERELRQRYKRAVDDLAHSLKTPLSVVSAELETSGIEHKQTMQMALAQMRQLIKDRLARVRIAPVLRSDRRLAPVIERLFSVMNRLYPGKVSRCLLASDYTVPMAQSDLMELFGSLLENAFRLSEGQILVEPDASQPGVVRVHDDGPGIAREDRQRVLDRGARADTRHAGEGLGLAIALDIVSSYGGEIAIETSHLGGAAIKLTLPV